MNENFIEEENTIYEIDPDCRIEDCKKEKSGWKGQSCLPDLRSEWDFVDRTGCHKDGCTGKSRQMECREAEWSGKSRRTECRQTERRQQIVSAAAVILLLKKLL